MPKYPIIMIFGYSGTIGLRESLVMFASIYLLELTYACITAWPAWIIATFLKIREGIDVYNINTNFNPFIFK
jgi:hypothetical protein